MPSVSMVAGPNGSGKTTLIRHLIANGIKLGEYINPDDIAADLSGPYDDRVREAQRMADDMREACLARRASFTFETVMSHLSKVEFFARATAAGFESVLYYVSTGDAALNVARVAQRVRSGGHDVPEERILSRFDRSLEYLPAALRVADRAFIYENSGPSGMVLGLTKDTTRQPDGSFRASYVLTDGAPDWIRTLYEGV